MRYLKADYVFPITARPIKDGVVAVGDDGVIKAIGVEADFGTVDIESHRGILLPGFINTHCHLELSHMKGLVPTGTKLIPFITKVIKLRDFDSEIIQENIKLQDEKMWAAGIQAVGDISNKADTAEQKMSSPISYYTFVELFDMMQPSMTKGAIENYRAAFRDQARGNGNDKSMVPHASYSVTPELFDFINKANPEDAIISIHNTETAPENFLFRHGGGDFKKFFETMGLSLKHFKPTGTNAIKYVLKHLQPKKKNLFVHNTLTTSEDIKAAHKWSSEVYWVSCPNANLYIENRLPDYSLFLSQDCKMTLGTDSIMSNWQLDIWEEIKAVRKYQSAVSFEEVFSWATINGAQALGYDKNLGSIEVGKQPGLVHIDVEWKGEDTDLLGTKTKRLV